MAKKNAFFTKSIHGKTGEMDAEFLKLLNRMMRTVAEKRTCVFEEKWGKFKSKATRKKFYDNQFKQMEVTTIGETEK